MPKISKVKAVSSRPGEASPPKEILDKYLCTRCGRIFKRQKQNFPSSQSLLFKGNRGYLSTCCHCVDELFAHYKNTLGDETAAMRRICMKFDIYWAPEIYAMVNKANTTNSRVRGYISKTNLYKYTGKTYDDTLDEEGATVVLFPDVNTPSAGQDALTDDEAGEYVPDRDVVKFWGSGFPPETYSELDARYMKWTEDVVTPIDSATEALYRQVCILEVMINKAASAGKPVESMINALNNVLSSLNVKPIQKKQDEAMDAPFDSVPFGVGIRMCENTRPIPKPDPRFDDVDGIVKYISVWFLGHLCKMLGIRNTYCKLYEQEIARMRVERPELEDEDDEEVFNDIFGDGHT